MQHYPFYFPESAADRSVFFYSYQIIAWRKNLSCFTIQRFQVYFHDTKNNIYITTRFKYLGLFLSVVIVSGPCDAKISDCVAKWSNDIVTSLKPITFLWHSYVSCCGTSGKLYEGFIPSASCLNSVNSLPDFYYMLLNMPTTFSS